MAQMGYASCSCCGLVYPETEHGEFQWARDHKQPCPWWPWWRRIAWLGGYRLGVRHG